jgi:hypothetical protein
MMNLEVLFENWFDDYLITRTRLALFARQHLEALRADNGSGAFTEIIGATEPLLAAVEARVTARETRVAVARGRVQSKQDFRRGLPARVRRLHAAVVGAFGEPSPDLTACFPLGRRVFGVHGARDEDLNNHLEQLERALTERSASVGAATVAAAGALCAEWLEVFARRQEAGAASGFSASERDAASGALRAQLCRNALTVALHYHGSREACGRFLPQWVLFKAKAAKNGEGGEVVAV